MADPYVVDSRSLRDEYEDSFDLDDPRRDWFDNFFRNNARTRRSILRVYEGAGGIFLATDEPTRANLAQVRGRARSFYVYQVAETAGHFAGMMAAGGPYATATAAMQAAHRGASGGGSRRTRSRAARRAGRR